MGDPTSDKDSFMCLIGEKLESLTVIDFIQFSAWCFSISVVQHLPANFTVEGFIFIHLFRLSAKHTIL
jgi:hypothetical protein